MTFDESNNFVMAVLCDRTAKRWVVKLECSIIYGDTLTSVRSGVIDLDLLGLLNTSQDENLLII